MDLFEVFPKLTDIEHTNFHKKSLRLIAISGFVYDEGAVYFEISPKQYWGRLPEGQSVIGVGLPKVKPDGMRPPYQPLLNHLRQNWRCETALYPPGYSFLLNEKSEISMISGIEMPFIMQLTSPKLGGTNIPDYLVQAVYLLPVQRFRWQNPISRVGLLRISRTGFTAFIKREIWTIQDLLPQSWCDVKATESLPQDAIVRTVLTLRGIRQLFLTDKINLDLLRDSLPN